MKVFTYQIILCVVIFISFGNYTNACTENELDNISARISNIESIANDAMPVGVSRTRYEIANPDFTRSSAMDIVQDIRNIFDSTKKDLNTCVIKEKNIKSNKWLTQLVNNYNHVVEIFSNIVVSFKDDSPCYNINYSSQMKILGNDYKILFDNNPFNNELRPMIPVTPRF